MGGIGVVIGYGFFFYLSYIANLWYIFSLIVGETINYFISFFVHKYITFRDMDETRKKKEMAWYSLIALGYFFITLIMTPLLSNWLLQLPSWLSKGILIFALAWPNYRLSRKVFHPEEKEEIKKA